MLSIFFRMWRFTQFARSPILLSMFPFGNDNRHDISKTVMDTVKLDDELGWDRVKKIFKKNEYGTLTKELQSIINMTLSGATIGLMFGGLNTTRSTVENFIANNEATRFDNHRHAKQHLNQKVMINFLTKGGSLAGKLGLFCFMFSCMTTCTTAYRGKLRIENYILGASITGFLFKINLGIRGAFVGTALAGGLGAICGAVSILILSISGLTLDEVLQVQKDWIDSKKDSKENVRKSIANEQLEILQIFEQNQKLSALQARKNVEDDEI